MFVVSANCGPVKSAVTARPLFINTVHVAISSRFGMQPPQLPTPEPAAAVALSVTLEPPLKFAPHLLPQSMPGGVLFTVPVPIPDLVTDRKLPNATDIARPSPIVTV